MAGTVANVIRAAVDSITLDSIDVGFTLEPYVLTAETTTEDVLVEQLFSPIRRVMTSRTLIGAVTLAEVTLANLCLAFSMPASNISGSTLTLDQDERGSVSCVIVGKSGSAPGTSKKRTFNFPQTVVSGAVSYNVAKGAEASLPVELMHLPDSSGIHGTIVDSAA